MINPIANHYRSTVVDSLRIAAEPTCGAPWAWRAVARNNLALLADARGWRATRRTAADVLPQYRAAVARMR